MNLKVEKKLTCKHTILKTQIFISQYLMAMVKVLFKHRKEKIRTIHLEHWVNKPVCFINTKNQICTVNLV